jgi:hypothetical protein
MKIELVNKVPEQRKQYTYSQLQFGKSYICVGMRGHTDTFFLNNIFYVPTYGNDIIVIDPKEGSMEIVGKSYMAYEANGYQFEEVDLAMKLEATRT